MRVSRRIGYRVALLRTAAYSAGVKPSAKFAIERDQVLGGSVPGGPRVDEALLVVGGGHGVRSVSSLQARADLAHALAMLREGGGDTVDGGDGPLAPAGIGNLGLDGIAHASEELSDHERVVARAGEAHDQGGERNPKHADIGLFDGVEARELFRRRQRPNLELERRVTLERAVLGLPKALERFARLRVGRRGGCSHQLAEKGIKFPLPFGIGVNYITINQNVDIKGVQIAVNDSQYVNLDKIVKFDKVTSSVQGVGARFDLWVLPFFNVYGLANYAANSDTEVVLASPFPLRAGADQTGYGGGFGVTGAFGVFGFFATLDANWTWNKLQKLDAPVRTFLLTPRIGKKFRVSSKVSVSPWVGAMRQEVASDTSGSISLRETIGEPTDSFKQQVGSWYESLSRGQQAVVGPIIDRLQGADPIIHYKLDKTLADPWNMLLGAEVDLDQRVQMRMEFGFLGRTQLLMGLSYRFGLITQ